jgi:hypothetical protein
MLSSIFVTEFKPNVSIQKSNTLTTLCSGEQLQLVSCRISNEAYQLAIFIRQSTNFWIDVPTTNNNPTTNFQLKDVLCDIHSKLL